MLVYSIGCNLKCYGCFNYEALIANPIDTCDDEYIIDSIKRNGFMFDSIIFSGGEFLVNRICDIERVLNRTRDIFSGVIIVNTNGTFPEKVKHLIDLGAVDGIHLDIKLPIDVNSEYDIKEDVIGFKNVDLKLVYETADIIAKRNSPLSRFRTVKYPILSDEYFDLIKLSVAKINEKNKSNIEWSVNDFLDV